MNYFDEKAVREALLDIQLEISAARRKFRAMASPHEGYAVMLEEFDELWDEIKSNASTPLRLERCRKEAMQVAATAICFMVECCDHDDQPRRKS